jgi:hypothetical protein
MWDAFPMMVFVGFEKFAMRFPLVYLLTTFHEDPDQPMKAVPVVRSHVTDSTV